MSETPNSETPTPETPKSDKPQSAAVESFNRPVPAFGWTAYAEQFNGRFAMIGIVALILIELFSGQGLIAWLGF
ncbi:MAG: chlorophyll A-B-binding protein [Oscillatoriales cyanobacterium C42_A2020_001]|nr:chlorophyll A-B-binding protein [Leptolyngbyaceae cyanobacterium C42_A2020_001]